MNNSESRWTLNVLFVSGERVEIGDISRETGESAIQSIHRAMGKMSTAITVGTRATITTGSIRAAYLSQETSVPAPQPSRHSFVTGSKPLVTQR